ncbi:MAG TPA: class I adenylate-forming enzyme family protein, partial [Orrella sp.]
MNIVTSLLTRARSHPALAAVTSIDGTLTFAQLARNAHALAAALRSQAKLEVGDRVVLFMENRGAYFEALMACWIAGVVPVPVNAKLHPRELGVIIEDSGARLVFTSEVLVDSVTQLLADMPAAPQLVSVQSGTYRDWLALDVPGSIAVHNSAPNDLAWLFYTSGTTGAPKGAMLTHRNLMMMVLQYFADVDAIRPGETMLHAAPLSHASGLYALPHLLAGGHQVVQSGFDADAVLEALQQYQDVTLFGAPTMLTRLLTASVGVPNARGHLKMASYGGAPMYLNDLLAVMDVFGTDLFAIYGQGESPMTITG